MVKKSQKTPVEPKVSDSEPEPTTTGETRRYTDRHTVKANPNFVQGTVEPTEKKTK